MFRPRVIPVLLLKNSGLVKTIKFDKFRDVGNPISSSKVYNDSDADELVFLNISRESRTIDPLISF